MKGCGGLFMYQAFGMVPNPTFIDGTISKKFSKKLKQKQNSRSFTIVPYPQLFAIL